jgi:dTMP kinase
MRPVNNPVFIVFEGLDGSGKSSTAERTADLLGAVYLKTPAGPLLAHRESIISSFNGNQEAAQLMYLASVADASRIVKRHLAEGRSVVLDRYLLSTQVYADFRGSKLAIDDAISKVLCPADLTVFLDAPLALRRSRISKRASTVSVADAETLVDSADSLLREGYRRRFRLPIAGRVVEIDSSQFDIDEIANFVSAELSQLQGELE